MENQNEILDSDLLNVSSNVEEQKIISTNMFIFLCIITVGIYPVWWIYKAWRFFNQKDEMDILPAARAFFSIIFLYPLLLKIQYFANEKEYEKDFSPSILFIGFVIGNFLSKLPEPYGLVSIFSFVFLIPPFNALNYAKLNSNDLIVSEQTSFNGRQIVLIILGLIFWALIILGLVALNKEGLI